MYKPATETVAVRDLREGDEIFIDGKVYVFKKRRTAYPPSYWLVHPDRDVDDIPVLPQQKVERLGQH